MHQPRQNIHIAARLKPLSSSDSIPISIHSSFISLQQGNTTKEFVFDQIFQSSTTQEQIYQSIGFGLVERVVEGFHATILSYGQTGAGKTHTIFGDPDNYGIIPRAAQHLLNIRDSDQMRFILRVGCIEIYNELIRDLLDECSRKQIKQSKQGVYVKDMAKVLIKSYDDFRDVLNTVESMRSTHETAMNRESSRSHCIMTFYLQIMEEVDGEQIYKEGRLYCVDLAGSQRQKKTNSVGLRLREANSINKNLVVLRNVIHALIENKDYVPYRDSKLTRLLQDSFGGGTKTTMIANISTDLQNINETISTLRYAAVASKVSNCPVIHYDAKDLLIKQYVEEIKVLKEKQQINSHVKQMREKDELLAERHQISQALELEQQANLVLKNRIEELSRLISPNTQLPPLQKSKFTQYRKRKLKSLIEKGSILEKSKQMILDAEIQFENEFQNENLESIDIVSLKQKYQNLKGRYLNLRDELKMVSDDHKEDRDLCISKQMEMERDNLFLRTVIHKYISLPELNYIRSNSTHLPSNEFSLPEFKIIQNGIEFPNRSTYSFQGSESQRDIMNNYLLHNPQFKESKGLEVRGEFKGNQYFPGEREVSSYNYNPDEYRDKSKSVSRKRRFQPLKSPRNTKATTFPPFQTKPLAQNPLPSLHKLNQSPKHKLKPLGSHQ